MEGSIEREEKRIGYGHGNFKDRTQEISLGPGMGVGCRMGVVRVTTPPSPRLFAFGAGLLQHPCPLMTICIHKFT